MEFKAFLSHRYKSPDVNLFFHKIFSEVAEVQFDVDVGQLPTNVTRLEKMIRDADAFIGIYPFEGNPHERIHPSELQNASKYFRLEYDLAIRSKKTILVFYDQRFSQIFDFSPRTYLESFDIQEVTGKGGSPNKARFEKVFRNFCDEVNAYKTLRSSSSMYLKKSEIGILVPQESNDRQFYTQKEVDAIKQMLSDFGFNNVKQFHYPSILKGKGLFEIEELDWLIADVGEIAVSTGIIGYVHGRFVPTIRLVKGIASINEILKESYYQSLYENTLGIGYPKDIIAWNNLKQLSKELYERLLTLTAPVNRISSQFKSENYFRKASLRKEHVFLSYSGTDSELALQISKELRKRFQQVFDYKDVDAITPGEPWLKEIFTKLSLSSLGIPLITSNYLRSGNCEHEALEMVAQRDSGKLILIPIKLYKEDKFDLPEWMSNRQYLHIYDYPDISSMVDKLVEFFDKGLTKLN